MITLNESIDAACDCVRLGGLIAYPTESVFGIGCDPLNTAALNRLLSVKTRDVNKGLIIVASSLTQLSEYMQPLDDNTLSTIKATWPGPVTWIVPTQQTVSPLLTGNRDTLAVRVSAHPVVQQLCQRLEHPLVSTSANISGEPALKTADSVVARLGSEIDFVVDAPTGGDEKPTKIFDALTQQQLR